MRKNIVWNGALLCAVWTSVAPASAQSLGTLRWQLEPYCNVLTLAITQSGAGYRLEGSDDQCGAGAGAGNASAIGTAFINADGTIGFGVAIVTTPGGAPVHVDATVPSGGVNGTWRDSLGHSGALSFTLGASTGGNPRPLPAPTVPGSIHLQPDGGLVATGTPGAPIPATGTGTRLMWHAGKAALRAGRTSGTEWDDSMVGRYSTALGDSNAADGVSSTSLGMFTRASGQASVAMGDRSLAGGFASLAAGELTAASGTSSVALGLRTAANGDYAVAAGTDAVASGRGSVAVGNNVTAGGAGSLALGSYVETGASSPGTFIFGDASTTLFTKSQLPNQFIVRAVGGVSFRSSDRSGVVLPPGASAWSSTSDVHTKENFRELTSDDVLARIARMPVREWNYKWQDKSIRHMGPTAQDFHAAFGLGEDPLRISTIDADGVALAGVQALDARGRAVETRHDADLAALRAEIAALHERVQQLEGRPPSR